MEVPNKRFSLVATTVIDLYVVTPWSIVAKTNWGGGGECDSLFLLPYYLFSKKSNIKRATLAPDHCVRDLIWKYNRLYLIKGA